MLVSSLLPDWHDVEDPHALEITRLSGALTNRVYEVRFRDPNDTKHTSRRVLLRVYGSGVDKLFSRAKELDWLRKLSAVGLGPRLLAVFGNGRLEEYFRSVTLTHDDLRDPATSEKIAQGMAQLHKLGHTYPPPEGHKGEWPVVTREWLPQVRRMVDTMSDAAMARLRQILHTEQSPAALLQQLEHEIDCYEMAVARVDSPVVLCHNDLQYGNILRLRDSPDTLVLIDFEYTGYNPRGYDIANHFCEWMANYHGPTPHHLDAAHFPSNEECNRFLHAYLAESLDRPPTADEVHALWGEVEQFIPCSHLVWALWGLLQADRDDIDFDYLAYGAQRLCMSRQYAQQLGFW
ncbi:kinase-like domain-containing protein [Syncephalis pseudoplumigaleata]|uniref:Kinase-like domain-containing protein n=1 Tax=Syncephalis pseudoplumigaleata TaxID=1712513 RepID=A0A4P9YVW9_9FUNG|nr:kinase-like domain-containing protein [Syncephalis pseudoplumigaleata]|eukprot:RKP24157.1 kinase-like domain-containing protein [Syncephalis pseudoplumigaleata]